MLPEPDACFGRDCDEIEDSLQECVVSQVLAAMPDLDCYNNPRHIGIMVIGGLGFSLYSFGNAHPSAPARFLLSTDCVFLPVGTWRVVSVREVSG